MRFQAKQAKLERGGRTSENYRSETVAGIMQYLRENPLGSAWISDEDLPEGQSITEDSLEGVRSAHKNALTAKFGIEYPDPKNAKKVKSGIESRTRRGTWSDDGTFTPSDDGQIELGFQLAPAYLLAKGLATQEQIVAASTGTASDAGTVDREPEENTEENPTPAEGQQQVA